PVVEHTEAVTASLRARDHEMPIDRYAALVVDRWYEPGGARSQRMYGHGEAETRRPGLDRLPGLPGIGGAKNPVVVLNPQVVRVGRTADHAMRVLDIGIVAPLGRHVIGAQAFTRAGPTGAAIAALPDPAAGHRHADVLAVLRIDTDGMDARPVVAATCPFGPFRTLPEWAIQCPAIAVIGGMEQPARKGARPEHAGFIGTAGFQRPYLLQAPGRRWRQIGASRCGHRFGLGRIDGHRTGLPGAAGAPAAPQLDAEMPKVERGVECLVTRVGQDHADWLAHEMRFGLSPLPGDGLEDQQAFACGDQQAFMHVSLPMSATGQGLYHEHLAGITEGIAEPLAVAHGQAIDKNLHMPTQLTLIIEQVTAQTRLLLHQAIQCAGYRIAQHLALRQGEMALQRRGENHMGHGSLPLKNNLESVGVDPPRMTPCGGKPGLNAAKSCRFDPFLAQGQRLILGIR